MTKRSLLKTLAAGILAVPAQRLFGEIATPVTSSLEAILPEIYGPSDWWAIRQHYLWFTKGYFQINRPIENQERWDRLKKRTENQEG